MHRVLVLLLFILAACGEDPTTVESLTPLSYDDLVGWSGENHAAALDALHYSCTETRKMKAPCDLLPGEYSAAQAKEFFETHFTPHEINDGQKGRFTGYYEPVFDGRRQRSAEFSKPVYALPDDMLTLNIADFSTELEPHTLVGRVVGKKVVPYHGRDDITAGPFKAEILAWMRPVDHFFLQIQGSGSLVMGEGKMLRLGYAGKNGHRYHAIGRTLIDRGVLTKENVSMQSIRGWLEENPKEMGGVFATNPSYVFFRKRDTDRPTGTMGVPLTAERSLAVDRRHIKLGSVLWLDVADHQRLMLAQDTGGAIKGVIRGDIYFGTGDEAGEKAGPLNEMGRYYLLIPKGQTADE